MSVSQYSTKKGPLWRVRYHAPGGTYTDKRGFKTKKDALLWESENRLSINAGTYVDTNARKIKLNKLLDDLMADDGALAPSSLVSRSGAARNWVAPYWDKRRLEEVTAGEVRKWIKQMRADGAGEPTVEKAFRVLSKMMELAVEDNLIRVSPMPKLALRKKIQRRQQFLTVEQVRDLVSEVEPRSRLLVRLLVFTGMRFGEAAALPVR